MTAADVAAAYSLARTAFATWRRTGPLDRAPVLAQCADPMRGRAEEQGAPGLRFYTRIKTTDVRCQW